MKLFKLTAVLLFVPVFSGTARAQQDVITAASVNGVGFYVGGNMGGGWDTACDNWEPGTTAMKGSRGFTNAFYHRSYPSAGSFNGAEIGYDVRFVPSVRGLGLDHEAYGGNYGDRTYAYAGASPAPRGSYTFPFSGKDDADGFFVSEPATGDAGDACFPYFRWGGVFTSGFATGAAIRYAIVDRCLFRAECTLNLGKTDKSVLSCVGASTTCARFRNTDLDKIYNSVAADIFRWPSSRDFDRGSMNARVATIER